MRLAKAKVHFIGIGGIGMCGLAELLHNMGVQVKGSDLSENQQTIRLREMGVKIYIGHDESHLGDVDVVVYTSAVKPDNPEYRGAKQRGIPMIPRAEALAEMMRLKRGVAIAGSHGKTTTTSMTAAVFLHAHFDPTIVVGGRLDLIKSTAKLGSGEWLIAEADESDGSFNRLSPEMAVITNIDDDHLDHYKTMDNLQSAFFEFATRIPFYGVAIVCGDDPSVREVFKDFPKRIVFYGFSEDNDYVLKGSRGQYKVFEKNAEGLQPVGSFDLAMPGSHNALNAMAAVLAGKHAGIPWDKCLRGVESFNGVDRRMQFKYEVRGVKYFDDYGHHPTEIKAVLAAMKEAYPKNRVVALFQPHRYTRTASCWQEFMTCFKDADALYMVDIYPAGETPIAGITSKKLTEAVDHSKKFFIESRDQARTVLSESLSAGDILLTLGAGDVWKLGDEISRYKR